MPKSLTIRSFLPEPEIEICSRLREFRLWKKLEQGEVAERLSITRSRLSSYEYAKAPIRYELGKEFCYRFNVNQRWLATGQEPKTPYFDVSPNLEFKIKPKDLFSTAYKVLQPHIEERSLELIGLYGKEAFYAGEVGGEALDNFHLLGEGPTKAAAFYVRKIVLLRLLWFPPDLQIKYAEAIMEADKTFARRFHKEIAEVVAFLQRPVPEVGAKSTESLTQDSLKSKSESMSEIQKLIKDVKKKAEQPGSRSELAKQLGVAPARISEWLSGKKEPGGEYTLRLAIWVYGPRKK